jgi:hypothetical protein
MTETPDAIDKTEHWRAHVEAWRASGLSQRAYCAQHHLSPHRLSYWSRKPPATTARNLTLVPLKLAPVPSGPILHGRHWRLEFPGPPAADWLAQLLGCLS